MRSLRRWATDGRWLIIVLVDKRALGPNGIERRVGRLDLRATAEMTHCRESPAAGSSTWCSGRGTPGTGTGAAAGPQKSAHESAVGFELGFELGVPGHYILVFGYDATAREHVGIPRRATLTRVGERRWNRRGNRSARTKIFWWCVARVGPGTRARGDGGGERRRKGVSEGRRERREGRRERRRDRTRTTRNGSRRASLSS